MLKSIITQNDFMKRQTSSDGKMPNVPHNSQSNESNEHKLCVCVCVPQKQTTENSYKLRIGGQNMIVQFPIHSIQQ